MKTPYTRKRTAAAAMLAAFSLLLTGCLVSPGKFNSTLALNADNSFAYSYRGELFFLALNPGAFADDDADEFEPSTCFNEEIYEDRECTEEEVAAERAEWEAGAAQRAQKKEEDAQQMAGMMGGINPDDPEAGNKLAAMLQRQKGWNTVTYAGEGIFYVDYSIAGMLSHDLTFPVMEGVPVPTPFIQVILRDDNQVRVNAPGFAKQTGDNPMTGMLMGGFAAGMSEAAAQGGSSDKKGIPKMEGTFSIITNGKILANNTDEGFVSSPSGDTLTWDISSATSNAPTALIQLGR